MPNSRIKHTIFFDDYKFLLKAIDEATLIPPLVTTNLQFDTDVKQLINIVEHLFNK